MPCHHHWGHCCPHCGMYHPWGCCPSCGGPGYGWGYGPPWVPPTPAYRRPAPARPMTDEDIQVWVSDRLRSDPRIPPQARIQAEVHNGVVTLTGTVPDKWSKQAAAEAALELPEVVDVQNNLQIG